MKCCVIRPYSGSLRLKVMKLLKSCNITINPDAIRPRSKPNEEIVNWLNEHHFEWVLMPFNSHKDNQNNDIDGVGVALLLGEKFINNGSKIIMPISSEENHAYFESRMEKLKNKNPRIHDLIIPVHEDQLDNDAIIRTIAASSN